ncbi:MAG: hypothetical protein ACOYYS_10045 [Chloroflexota bacterium]
MQESVKITPEQSLEILDQATQPEMIGRLMRQDYCKIQAALTVLAQFVAEHKQPTDAKRQKAE